MEEKFTPHHSNILEYYKIKSNLSNQDINGAGFTTNSAGETRKLAQKILEKYKNYHIFLLEGELGSGKTTFVQGIAKALGISEKIQSPTFVLEKRYDIFNPNYKKQFNKLIHIDLYRLKKSDQSVRDLSENFLPLDQLVMIEWSNKLGEYLPKKYLTIKFMHQSKNSRRIIIKDDL